MQMIGVVVFALGLSLMFYSIEVGAHINDSHHSAGLCRDVRGDDHLEWLFAVRKFICMSRMFT